MKWYKYIAKLPNTTAYSKFVALLFAIFIIPLFSRQNTTAQSCDTLPTTVELPSITVSPTKEHYSKRNNPAVDLMKGLRQSNRKLSPSLFSHYNFNRYERTVIGIEQRTDTCANQGKQNEFQSYRDTLPDGKTVYAPLALKERLSKHIYRQKPKSRKTVVYGLRNEGIDDFIEQENIRVFLDQLFKDTDWLDTDIDMFGTKFVSPFSTIAPDFYKFYIGDTISLRDNSRAATLLFLPRNKASNGFNGQIYYNPDDSARRIIQINLALPSAANINFVQSLTRTVRFEPAVNGSNIKVSDDLIATMRFLPGTAPVILKREERNVGHYFSEYSPSDIYSRLGSEFTTADAYLHDEEFWEKNRVGVENEHSKELASMMSRLRGSGHYRNLEQIAKTIITGYIPTSTNSKFDIGPITSTVSFNDVEGARFRFGGMTTAKLNNHIFARGFTAYGTKDKQWKYNAALEYSFNPKKRHHNEFPIHSVTVSAGYDTYYPGQHLEFTSPDNIFLSLKRQSDTLALYRREYSLLYQLEMNNHLSFSVSAFTHRLTPSRFLDIKTEGGLSFNHFTSTGFTLEIRYAPGEQLYQTRNKRTSADATVPIFVLSHKYLPKGVLGNIYGVNRTSLAFNRRFWFSAFGYADIVLKGSYCWTASPYFEFSLPNANLSYTIQRESFALLNPLEFIIDKSAEWHLTYWDNGAVFNQLPMLKRTGFRTVATFNGFFGTLSKKNNPQSNSDLISFPTTTTPMTSTPYMEVSVGIDNILKIFRIDYVWRLTYLKTHGIDRLGLRVGAHLRF